MLRHSAAAGTSFTPAKSATLPGWLILPRAVNWSSDLLRAPAKTSLARSSGEVFYDEGEGERQIAFGYRLEIAADHFTSQNALLVGAGEVRRCQYFVGRRSATPHAHRQSSRSVPPSTRSRFCAARCTSCLS